MRSSRLLPLALLLGVVMLVRADQPYDEIELNRLQLEKWKKDSSHYARLRRSLGEFLQMTPERQEAMRQLDRDLQAEDSATSTRLMRVLDRYAAWLNQLPEEDRQAVLKAGSAGERWQRIKQIRDREWILHEPKNVQEQLARLSAQEQTNRIAQLRKGESDFRTHWEAAIQYQDLFTKLRNQADKFNSDLQFFIQESLEPLLTPEEKKQLADSKDQWPLFEMKLVELADKHPIKLPGAKNGIKRFADLPESVKKSLPEMQSALKKEEGSWPEYANAVKAYAANKKTPITVPLGPSREADFPEPIRAFIKNDLRQVQMPAQKRNLQNAEGDWPRYAAVLLNQARLHRLALPGMVLPGPRDVWEAFRRKSAAMHDFLPEVDDRTLLDFANHELTADERSAWPSMSLSDPQAREEWKRAYFMRHPEVLKQRKRQDIRKEKAAAKN